MELVSDPVGISWGKAAHWQVGLCFFGPMQVAELKPWSFKFGSGSSCSIYHDLPFHSQFRRSTRQVIFGENWFTFTFIWTWSGEVHAIIRGRLLPDCTCVILCDLGLVAINWLNLGFKDVASLLRTPLHQSNVCAKNDDYIPCCFCFCCPRGGGWWELVLASGGFSWFKGLTCWEPSCSPGKSQWNPQNNLKISLHIVGSWIFFCIFAGFLFFGWTNQWVPPADLFRERHFKFKNSSMPTRKGKVVAGIRRNCWKEWLLNVFTIFWIWCLFLDLCGILSGLLRFA